MAMTFSAWILLGIAFIIIIILAAAVLRRR